MVLPRKVLLKNKFQAVLQANRQHQQNRYLPQLKLRFLKLSLTSIRKYSEK
jgi:hypothetical protein